MTRGCIGVLAAARLLGGCLLVSCVGNVTSPLGPGGFIEQKSGDVSFLCGDAQPTSDAMHRLSHRQYERTVRDLVESLLPGQFDDVWSELSSAFASLPADTTSKNAPFATMDQAMTQQHVDVYFNIARSVAQGLTADDARVEALLSCEGGESDQDCVTRFIERFGRRAFRHALSESELAFLNEVYAADGIDVDGLRDVIVVALNAPQFLYRVEFGAQAVAGKKNTFRLSGAELASRLSYHFWQTGPDDALLSAAEAGELDTDAGYEATLEQLVNDPRAAESVRLFVREWLHLDQLRPLDSLVGEPAFDAFAGADVPTPELRDEMIDEVLDSFVYHLGRDDAFSDWFTSPYSFAKSDELAAVYATEKWDESGAEPPRFPENERAGLLTRAALLATGTAKTRPIMKGVFIRERILCDRVPPPPANAANIPPELARDLSTREVVEKLTEQRGSQCAGCHATMINPLGFATENYDALGRLRSSEVLYDDDGNELAVKPIDTSSVPRVAFNDTQPAQGARDVADMIVRSGKAESCFARQYIRFAYGRREDEDIDGCALEAVRSALQDGQSLQQAMRAPALRPEFRQRILGDGP